MSDQDVAFLHERVGRLEDKLDRLTSDFADYRIQQSELGTRTSDELNAITSKFRGFTKWLMGILSVGAGFVLVSIIEAYLLSK